MRNVTGACIANVTASLAGPGASGNDASMIALLSLRRALIAVLLLALGSSALCATAQELRGHRGAGLRSIAPEKNPEVAAKPARPRVFDWREAVPISAAQTPGSRMVPVKSTIAPRELAPIVSGDGAIADFFANTMLFDGTRLFVAVPQDLLPFDRREGKQTGSVRLYTRAGAGWQSAGLIAPTDGETGFRFGDAIVRGGDLLLIGAPLAMLDMQDQRGAVYLYSLAGGTPQFLARLVSPQASAGERFGAALATDGTRLLIGAPRHPGAGGSESGRAWLFENIAGVWTATAQFDAPDAAAGDRFGAGVALDGDLALIGAPSDEDAGSALDRGAVHVFARSAASWQATQKLAPAMLGLAAGFGSAMLLGSDRLFVAASNDTVDGANRGAVYVFARSGGSFTETQRLRASDGAAGDAFGAALARVGNELLIGAPLHAGAEGAGYVFADSGTGYAEQALLDPDDGDFSDAAGASVAFTGDQALLGAPLDDIGPNRAQGSVQVFARNGGTWTETTPIDSGDGAENERFGLAAAIGRGTIAVGSFLDEITFNEDDQGTVTLFRNGPTGYAAEQRVTGPDSVREDFLGFAVALDGARLIAAAPRAVILGQFDQGALYEFERDASGWRFVAKLAAEDGLGDDNFGFSLAADAGRLLVGAPGYDAFDFESGAAYLLRRGGSGTLELEALLLPPQGSPDAAAGITVALDGEIALVGAPQASVLGRVAQGAVFVYTRTLSGWGLSQILSAADGRSGDLFGGSLAVRAGRIAIGAVGDDTDTALDHGAVYVFDLPQNGTYGAPLKLLPATLANGLGFGTAVFWREGELLVGASGAAGSDGDVQQGQVVRLRREGSDYVAAGTLEASQGVAREFFGRTIVGDASALVVGAPEKPRANPREGAAYVFTSDVFEFADGFE
jgi:hypothetical protein